jgi:hypothetical protein
VGEWWGVKGGGASKQPRSSLALVCVSASGHLQTFYGRGNSSPIGHPVHIRAGASCARGRYWAGARHGYPWVNTLACPHPASAVAYRTRNAAPFGMIGGHCTRPCGSARRRQAIAGCAQCKGCGIPFTHRHRDRLVCSTRSHLALCVERDPSEYVCCRSLLCVWPYERPVGTGGALRSCCQYVRHSPQTRIPEPFSSFLLEA